MPPAAVATPAPLQARSRKSLAKMLDAAERILARKEFDDMSIAEIADEAGVSVGNFYTRFRNKEALLDVLHERYEHERLELLIEAFAKADQPAVDLAGRALSATRAIVALFRARRGVLRSLVLRHWRNPAAASGRTKHRVDKVMTRAHALLLAARDEISHPDPELAVRLGFAAVLATCREAIVLRPPTLPGGPKLGDEQLAGELARLLRAYLATNAPQGPRA